MGYRRAVRRSFDSSRRTPRSRRQLECQLLFLVFLVAFRLYSAFLDLDFELALGLSFTEWEV